MPPGRSPVPLIIRVWGKTIRSCAPRPACWSWRCGPRCRRPGAQYPLHALDTSLDTIATEFGKRTAAWVALQMRYPGY